MKLLKILFALVAAVALIASAYLYFPRGIGTFQLSPNTKLVVGVGEGKYREIMDPKRRAAVVQINRWLADNSFGWLPISYDANAPIEFIDGEVSIDLKIGNVILNLPNGSFGKTDSNGLGEVYKLANEKP